MEKKNNDKPDFSIRKFNPKNIKHDRIILMIGKRGSGKSVLETDVMSRVADDLDYGYAMTQTIGSLETFLSCIPEECVHEDFNVDVIDNMIQWQRKSSKKYKKQGMKKDQIKERLRRIFVILDDMTFDESIWKNKAMKAIFMNGRHYNIFFMTTLQYIMGIPIDLRSQIDYVFAFWDNSGKRRKKLWDEYFTVFSEYKDFERTFKQCTGNYECMVLDNTVNSPVVTDSVFYYRGDINRPKFTMGNDKFWALHARHFVSDDEREILKKQQMLELQRQKEQEEEEEQIKKEELQRHMEEEKRNKDDKKGGGRRKKDELVIEKTDEHGNAFGTDAAREIEEKKEKLRLEEEERVRQKIREARAMRMGQHKMYGQGPYQKRIEKRESMVTTHVQPRRRRAGHSGEQGRGGGMATAFPRRERGPRNRRREDDDDNDYDGEEGSMVTSSGAHSRSRSRSRSAVSGGGGSAVKRGKSRGYEMAQQKLKEKQKVSRIDAVIHKKKRLRGTSESVVDIASAERLPKAFAYKPGGAAVQTYQQKKKAHFQRAAHAWNGRFQEKARSEIGSNISASAVEAY